MTFGELFAGISGFGLGFEQAGMKCLWQVELDRDCNRVLEARYPTVKRIRDVREAGKHNLEPVDVIAFGWPCQDLSLAGLRAGISGERSGLFHEAARVIQELRPKWIVAENVPGLFSSYTPVDAPPGEVAIGTEWEVEEDSDFERVLATLDELGYCVSWRVCDAQFWNVAQRRERVFLVGSLGNLGSLEVFPFAESMPGDFETRREAGTGVAPTITGGFKGAGGGNRPGMNTDQMESLIPVAATLDQRGRGPTDAVMMNLQIAPTLESGANRTGGTRPPGSTVDTAETLVVTHALRSEGADASEDGTGRGTPIVVQPGYIHPRQMRGSESSNQVGIKPDADVTDALTQEGPGAVMVSVDLQNTRLRGNVAGTLDTTRPSRGGGQAVIAFSSKDHGADAGEIAPTLRSQNFDKGHINSGGQVAIAFDTTQITSKGNYSNPKEGDPCHPLAEGAHAPAIAFTERTRNEGRTFEAQEELAYAITNPGSGGRTHSRQVAGQFGVRRLTPRECERLMGLPDDWTLYDAAGKIISDSARYRMLGNSIVVPVSRWIGERIMKVAQK